MAHTLRSRDVCDSLSHTAHTERTHATRRAAHTRCTHAVHAPRHKMYSGKL